MILLLLLLLSAVTNPIAPTSVPSGSRPTPTGGTIAVHSGNDLQAIYNAASCGSDLVLDAGAVFTGNYTFNKQCTAPNWILVEGAGCNNGSVSIPTYLTLPNINSNANPPVSPPTLTNYAKITTAVGLPPISTSNGSNVPAKYNYFGCLEVTSTTSQFVLVSTSNSLNETLTSQLPDHLMFDRLYIHGTHSSTMAQIIRGMLVTGGNNSIINSYISEVYYSGGDSQAILLAFGPGPNLISNNFLSGSTETLMAGGTDKSPGYSCTLGGTPTTTTATVNTCIDAASGSVATPPIGTQVMFFTSASSPNYVPADWTTITGNTGGNLTFNAIPSPPLVGTGKVKWGILPNDNTVTSNLFWKDPCWNAAAGCYDGIVRTSKDFIETKYGLRWNINANAFINTWDAGQPFAFNFTAVDQTNNCPWCTSSDIKFTNFIVKNITGAFVIIASQNGPGACPGSLTRVQIQNGLFFTQTGGKTMELFGNVCLTSGGGVDSLQLKHLTMLGAGTNMVGTDGLPFNFPNLVIQDNLTEFDQTRWSQVAGNCAGPTPNLDGQYCITHYVTTDGSATISNNAIINSGTLNGGNGVSDSTLLSRYGSYISPVIVDSRSSSNYSGVGFTDYSSVGTDYHNFALLNSSPFFGLASDGTNPGVNFATLDAAFGFGPPVPNPPTILTTSPLPGGTNGVPYAFTFAASSSLPVSWSATGLPGWATLNSAGFLAGTPNAVATTTINVTATNSSGSDGPHAFSLNVVSAGVAPTILNTSPITQGVYNQTYSYQFNATGTSPMTWTAQGLPSWLTLSSSGLLSGTPTSFGTSSFTIRVDNLAGHNGPLNFTLTIVQPAPPKPKGPKSHGHSHL